MSFFDIVLCKLLLYGNQVDISETSNEDFVDVYGICVLNLTNLNMMDEKLSKS